MKKETTKTTKKHTQQNFLPFPHGSINLLVGPSNVGKSTYVANLLQNPDLYFSEPLFQRIVIVNCHSAVENFQYQQENSKFLIIRCLLSNFEVEILQPGDVLIFEDVQEISASIKLAVTTIVHHLNLTGCFIICHSILGSRLFEILQFCHQIILFLTSSAVSRLALYIVRAFFVDEQLKAYLKTIISTAESQQAILHLSLNPIAGSRNPNHLALSHLPNLKKDLGGFCIIYPNLRKMKDYEDKDSASLFLNEEPHLENTFLEHVPDNLSPESYLMINAKSFLNIKELQQNQVDEKTAKDKCAKNTSEENWLFAVNELESDIEDSFPAAKIFKAKALARELLKNSSLCLGVNGRTMHFINKPKWTFSILDFISVAIRMAGPTEMDKLNSPNYKLYRAVTKSLLSKDCPTHFIKNKILLTLSSSSSRRSMPKLPNKSVSSYLKAHQSKKPKKPIQNGDQKIKKLLEDEVGEQEDLLF